LKSALNTQVLDSEGIPPDVYINGILPKITNATIMKGFSIDPAEFLPQGTDEPECENIRGIVKEILHRLISKAFPNSQPRVVKLTPHPPLATDPSGRVEPIWIRQHNFYVSDDISGNSVDFSFQAKPVKGFPLLSAAIPGNRSQIEVPETIESPREWIEQKVVTLARPYVGISQRIAMTAFNPSMKPNVASGKEPSASSGEISVNGLCRWISSGFTYPYLFLKRSRGNQKSYSITIVIDNVCRLFAPFNSTYMIGTTAAILGAFSDIPDPDYITIDILAVSDEQAHLLVHDLPVQHVSKGALINNIILTARHSAGYESGIGIGIQAALQLAVRRSGIGSESRIFAITDAIVTTPGQILALKSALIDCESSGISVVGIGVGCAPFHLHELFPTAVHCPNSLDLDRGLAAALDVSGGVAQIPIRHLNMFSPYANVSSLKDVLSGIPRLCLSLQGKISSQPLSQDFFEPFLDTDLIYGKGKYRNLPQNPETEPCHVQ
jgi:hypothetical protein